MTDYIQRMINEKESLSNKIYKLQEKIKDDDFMNGIGEKRRNLLTSQLGVMYTYEVILNQRIELELSEFK